MTVRCPRLGGPGLGRPLVSHVPNFPRAIGMKGRSSRKRQERTQGDGIVQGSIVDPRQQRLDHAGIARVSQITPISARWPALRRAARRQSLQPILHTRRLRRRQR